MSPPAAATRQQWLLCYLMGQRRQSMKSALKGIVRTLSESRSCPIRLHCSHCHCVVAASGGNLLDKIKMFFCTHIYKQRAQVEKYLKSLFSSFSMFCYFSSDLFISVHYFVLISAVEVHFIAIYFVFHDIFPHTS